MWTEVEQRSDVWRQNPPEFFRLVSHESIFWYPYNYIEHFYVFFFRKKGTPCQGIYNMSGHIYEVSGHIYEITGHIYMRSVIFFSDFCPKKGGGGTKTSYHPTETPLFLYGFYFTLRILGGFTSLVGGFEIKFGKQPYFFAKKKCSKFFEKIIFWFFSLGIFQKMS